MNGEAGLITNLEWCTNHSISSEVWVTRTRGGVSCIISGACGIEVTVGSGTWVYSVARKSISLKARLANAHSKILSNKHTYSIGVTDVTTTCWYADVAGESISLKAFITST